MTEFDGLRAELYAQALAEFPRARRMDIDYMQKYLQPKPGENILEVGAGNGLFSSSIADAIKNNGKLFISDPSHDQLKGVDELERSNIVKLPLSADLINLRENSLDAIWSCGAIHHIQNKTKAFERFHALLKKGGRLIFMDVFVGSKLAKHFDDRVAKYCITGHEVSFLTREFTESLCMLSSLKKPIFKDIMIHWKFRRKEDIGIFLHKLHAMTKTSVENCLRGAEEILGIEKIGDFYCLCWPLTVVKTQKE